MIYKAKFVKLKEPATARGHSYNHIDISNRPYHSQNHTQPAHSRQHSQSQSHSQRPQLQPHRHTLSSTHTHNMPNMPNRFSHPLRKFSGDVQDFVYNQAKSFEVDDDQTPPFSPLPSPIAHSNVNPVEIAAGICLNTSVQFDKFANLSINSLPPPPPPPPPPPNPLPSTATEPATSTFSACFCQFQVSRLRRST